MTTKYGVMKDDNNFWQVVDYDVFSYASHCLAKIRDDVQRPDNVRRDAKNLSRQFALANNAQNLTPALARKVAQFLNEWE